MTTPETGANAGPAARPILGSSVGPSMGPGAGSAVGPGSGSGVGSGVGSSHGRAAGSDPSLHSAAKVGNLNVANVLTGVRLAAVPFFGWALLVGADQPLWRSVAAWIFAAAALTDRIDGELARRRGLITDLGKIADPIADKALMGTALVILSVLEELPWWVTIVVLVREIGITMLRLVVIRHGVMPAGKGGKAKTVLQGFAILGYLIPSSAVPFGDVVHTVAVVLMGAALLLTVGTGVDYVIKAIRVVANSDLTASRGKERDAGRG
jgi:CDP-diacylglycerol--glycerol-3-phosphate 3-phosphatidyltransferase